LTARIAILASGGGTNLQAVLDACGSRALDAQVVLVVSNRRHAFALKRARNADVPAEHLPSAQFETRDRYDLALAELVAGSKPDLVILAGWMRILGATFLDAFPNRVLNLHPALPGAFPGLQAIERAHAAAVRGDITETGVMVHLALPEVDAGPVVVSEPVVIDPTASVATLEAQIHAVEHRLIVDAAKRTLNPGEIR
jgi:phosphoribosylglycinamide formyltransferase-1